MFPDAFNDAMDLYNHHEINAPDWMDKIAAGDYSEFPALDDNHHNEWDDHKTDYLGDMGWPDLENFDASGFGPSWFDDDHEGHDSWNGHFDSRGVGSGSPGDLADPMGWLSSLLPDTNDYDGTMTDSWATDSWSTDSWSPNSWEANAWDDNNMVAHTSAHFDFDMEPPMNDFKKPQKGSGPKGQKKPKGGQKGSDD